MKKKNKLFMILCIALCITTIAVTLTFKTSQITVNNVITFGDLQFKLLNCSLDENGKEILVDNDKIVKIENNSVSRIIRVENICDHEMFVRIKLNMDGKEQDKNSYSLNPYVEYNMSNNEWIYKDGWYYYSSSLLKNEVTDDLMNSIQFDLNRLLSDHPNSTIQMNVVAQAVQASHNQLTAIEATGWPKGE